MRLFHTLRYLKGRQLFYQLYYRLQRGVASLYQRDERAGCARSGVGLQFALFIPKATSFEGGSFTFLHRSHSFLPLPFPSPSPSSSTASFSSIDWEFSLYGKLWTYNLNYFDFLLQSGMEREEGLALIRSFVGGLRKESAGLEPYPVSLRGINWIKFLSQHQLRSAEIDRSLYAQYRVLAHRLEYHLLGNHLLENAFSLLFGACYFREPVWYERALRLLSSELDEQVLADGAHFELSPMYHQILLERLLDSVNLLQHNECFPGQDELLRLLQSKAAVMLSWLRAISFTDGSIPHLNDATDGIAPCSAELFAYADRLGVGVEQGPALPLRESGYRKFTCAGYECVVDIGRIGPDYIPGHAHADTLSFVMQVHDRPFLVDTGISTYEKGALRDEERGTAAHNTVVVNGCNSSDVWGGFRVGRRAGVKVLESGRNVMAEHDGYRRFGVVHRRGWGFDEECVVVRDWVKGGVGVRAEALFHFHHALVPVVYEGGVRVDGVSFRFSGAERVELVPYRQALGFNKTVEALCAVVHFRGELETVILFV